MVWIIMICPSYKISDDDDDDDDGDDNWFLSQKNFIERIQILH